MTDLKKLLENPELVDKQLLIGVRLIDFLHSPVHKFDGILRQLESDIEETIARGLTDNEKRNLYIGLKSFFTSPPETQTRDVELDYLLNYKFLQ